MLSCFILVKLTWEYFFWHENHDNKSEEHDLVSLLMGLIGQIDRSGKVLTTILWSCYDDFKWVKLTIIL